MGPGICSLAGRIVGPAGVLDSGPAEGQVFVPNLLNTASRLFSQNDRSSRYEPSGEVGRMHASIGLMLVPEAARWVESRRGVAEIS